MRTTFMALVLAVGLSACQSPHPQDMTGDELRDLLADGLTLKLGGPGEGYTGEARLEPDGTGTGSAVSDEGERYDITGRWEIDGDRFCRKWAFDDFKRTCETWRKVAPNRVDVFVNGKRVGTNSWSS